MAVSKAPAPPPGLEVPAHMAQNLQAYAMQRPWTPMGGVPPVPVDPSMPRQFPPSAAYHPGYGGNLTGAAKAALNLFNAPGPGRPPGPPGSPVVDQQERQRLEQAAKANAQRLLNSPLTRPKAGTVQPPSGEASETPSRDEPQNLPNDQRDQASQSVSSGPRYTGVLKVFKPESGYGFIECEELKKMYGCDVFMNQGIEGGILVGSEVSFTVELNKSGKPQAREARLEAEKSDLAEAAEPGTSNASGPRAADLLGKVFKGTVKSFNVARGFGFLTCPELKGTPFSGRDIYVSLAQVPDQRPLTTGHEVEFTFAVNQQGQPQGKDLKMMNSSPELDYLGELPTAQSVGDKLLRRVD